MRRRYSNTIVKPTPADNAAKKKVLDAMSKELREMMSLKVTASYFASVTLKRNAPEDAYAMAYEIADLIESALGEPYRISVYRINGEIVYQRWLPGELNLQKKARLK
jgi:hypothetical protein